MSSGTDFSHSENQTRDVGGAVPEPCGSARTPRPRPSRRCSSTAPGPRRPRTRCCTKRLDGGWPITWREYEGKVRALARGIADWVQPGEIVCILAENRPEWCYADLGRAEPGRRSARPSIRPTRPGTSPTSSTTAAPGCIFVSSREQLDKVRELRAGGRLCPSWSGWSSSTRCKADEDWVTPLATVLRPQQRPAGSDREPQRRPSLRRPGHAHLHLGHHRRAQGRDAQPRQPGLQRRSAPRWCSIASSSTRS